MKSESSQKAIKIDGNLWNELNKWLNTSQAKQRGFHSKAQFATEAIRDKMEEIKDPLQRQKQLSIILENATKMMNYISMANDHKSLMNELLLNNRLNKNTKRVLLHKERNHQKICNKDNVTECERFLQDLRKYRLEIMK